MNSSFSAAFWPSKVFLSSPRLSVRPPRGPYEPQGGGAEPGEVPLDLLALISPLRAVRASLGLDALERLGVLLLEELAPTLRGLEPLLSTREVETRAAVGSRGGLPAEEEADQGASDETSERGGD